jgi:hypothetical protein
MGTIPRLEQLAAERRRTAVRLFRRGTPVRVIAAQLKCSVSWVYKWINYQRQHLWTRFCTGSRAPHHHSNQMPANVIVRVLHLRKYLVRHTARETRFAGVGPRTIQREYRRRYGPPPSLSTIQRILSRNHCATPTPQKRQHYRPHPEAGKPNTVQTTDIITRWITGGAVIQTFHTVDIYSNDVASSSHAHKSDADACQHLLHAWKSLGIPEIAQFDNESAFSGGRSAYRISQVVRLCLYFGIQVLFTPIEEADYNWPVETFNGLWAKRFWQRHHFSRRCDVPRVQRTFLHWYRTDYVAPHQSDTPTRLQRGWPIHRLPTCWAKHLPDPLPICAGQIHAVRRMDQAGYVHFLNQPIRIGKRSAERYIWLTLDTAHRQLAIWYQRSVQADWRQLKVLDYALSEPVLPVLNKFARLHA